uniref:Uncharacterized protein n=1 Tax=Biomphalaria glabrata TaxID=6526 RepID=A0A2C9JWJ7_BIOGL
MILSIRLSDCLCLCASLTFAMVSVVTAKNTKDHSDSYKRVCYYTNWSQYRRDQGKFLPTDIDPHICTHLIFAFAKIDKGVLAPYEWNDLQYPFLYKQFNALKEKNPTLKTLLAVGGWTHGSQPFTEMVTSKASRLKFIQHAIEYLRTHGFDGLDLDWEYPANRGSPEGDRERFTALVQELREAFEKEAKTSNNKERLLLSAAVPGGERLTNSGYDVKTLNKYVDFFNLMSYDLHGSWSPIIGHHAPLIGGEKWMDAKGDSLSVEQSVNLWLKLGADPNKLVMGLALYGKTFKLCNKGFEPGDKSCGSANPDTLNYYEIVQKLKSGKYEKKWLENELVPYAYSPSEKLWVGFDDEESITAKVNFAKKKKLAGVMVWAIDGDDFSGKFGSGAKYPMMTAIRNSIEGVKDDSLKHSPNKLTELSEKDKDDIKKTASIEKKSAQVKEDQVLKEASALSQDKTAQSSSDSDSKAIQSSNTALNGETTPNAVPKIKNDSDLVKTDTEMIHKDEMRKKSDIIDLKTDQQSIINAPVVIRIPPAPYSDLDKELFQKPMAVPLHANLLAPKVGASDKKTSPKPEHKQRSITIHNTGAQLRERLKQVHQKFASSQTNLSSNAVSNRPVITIDKPASTERTPVIRKLGQRSRGQPKRNSPLKSSSVFEPPKETAYQYPTFIKYSPKSSLTSHSLIQQPSLAEASDTPWFTDIKAQEMNNPNQPKEKSTSGIKGKPKRRTTYSKPQSMMINAVPFAKSVAQLIEGKKTDEETQAVDKAKIVASQVANRNPSFGRYVTLHPEELEGWRTTVVAGTDAPEWVSRLMIEKKEPIKETANEDSDNLVSVNIQSLENQKQNSFFDKESSELKADDTSSEQVNENLPSNEGDGGRILAKVTLPYSLNQMKLRRKAARRHYFPTPYKSLSPFASQKEKLSRNYDRIPKISKYSRFNDDEIASIKQTHMKANRKYQMNAKPKRAQQPESALQNSGENKWWDGPTTSKSTATATPASLVDEATVFLRSSERKKSHYDQQSAGLVQERRDSKDSGLTLETTTANKKVHTTTDSKTEHEKNNRASEAQSPTKEEDFVNLNSFLQKTTSTQYVTSTRNHEEITTSAPQTSSRGFNLPARSSYKNNKPWWSVTTTTSAPSSGGIKTFKKHKFPNSGRKYHGESINAVHNELMGISDTPVFKGNLDLNKINPDVAPKDNLENIKLSKKQDVIVDEQTSKKLSLKNEMSEDAQEGKLNETETTSQANKVSDSNLPYETAKPDSQPYHSKLTLKTFKHNPTPEKIYHYRHAPGQSETEHSHRRINKLAENEIPHKGFSQPPSISSFTPDIRDWTKIRNLLRNSTVVAEIKSKLDEIHRSVTRDLTTEMPTEEPKKIDANGKKSSKWYERKAGSGNEDQVQMSPSVDTEVGQSSNSKSSVVKTNDDDSKLNVDSNSQSVDMLNKSPSNDDKSLSLIRNAKDDASMNKDTEPLISDISNKQIADSVISNKQIADKRQNNDEKALLKTPNTFQDAKSTSNNDVRKSDKAEKVLDDNDGLQWWEKNKKSDSKLSEVIEGKEDSNLIQSNAPVMSEKDANKERYEKYSSLRQTGPRRNKYNMSSAANSRSNVQTSTQEVSTKRFETTSADTRSMTKNSANTLTKYPMKKPSGTREFRDFKRPKNYNGYVVNNIRREGLRKNSAINAYSSRMQQSSQKNTNNSQSEVTQFMSNYGMKDPSRKLDSRHLQMNAVPENEPYQPKNTMMIEIVTQPGQTQPYDLMKENVDRVTDKPESSFKYKTVKNTGNFSCPSTFGIYPDTSDCRKFYQCVWYVAFHHMCGRGTAWNQDNRTCDWPKRTDCLLSMEGELVN